MARKTAKQLAEENKLLKKQLEDMTAAGRLMAAGMDPSNVNVSASGFAGDKVTIACKIGVPWLDLQLCSPHEDWENTPSGPRKVTIWRRTGQIVRIRGTAYPRGTAPEGFPDKPDMAAGAALTHNVPRDFWEQYVEQNKRSPMILNNMIFAAPTLASVTAQAKELKAETSGLDPVIPDKDKRIPRSTNQAVANPETEENRKSKMAAAEAA